MYYSIIKINEIKDYCMTLTFENGEVREFDMSPYLNFKPYHTLQDKSFFKKAHISFGCLQWSESIDIDPEIVYQESKICNHG